MAMKQDEVLKVLEAKDKEIAALQARIKDMDATKPGMTDADKRVMADAMRERDTRIAELEMALEESGMKVTRLSDDLAAIGQADALEQAGTLDMSVIDALSGTVQVGGMAAMEVVTLARSVASFGKPGVLLVCRAGDAVQVSIMEKMRIVRRGSPDKPVHVLETVG